MSIPQEEKRIIDRDFLEKKSLLYIGGFDSSFKGNGLADIFEKSFASYYQSKNINFISNIIKEKRFNVILIKETRETLNQIKEIRKSSENIPILVIGDEAINCSFDYMKHRISQYITINNTPTQILFMIEHELKNYDEQIHNIYTMEENKAINDVIDNAIIVSRTDLNGNIIYANDNFCEISEYTKEELLGKPHNIVRHPDMDSKVFFKMWETIKKGEIWTGVVKNLTKNGETYITKSTITPFYKNNEKLGYLGIRYLITDETKEKRDLKKFFIKKLFKLRKENSELKNQLTTLSSECARKVKMAIFESGGNPLLEKGEEIDLYYQKEIKKITSTFTEQLKEKDDYHHKVVGDELAKRRINSQEIEDYKKKIMLQEEKITILDQKNKELNKLIENKRNKILPLNKKIEEQGNMLKNIPSDVIAKYSIG